MKKILGGDVVDYRFSKDDEGKIGEGVIRSATVVRVWDDGTDKPKLNLVVFVDGTNDFEDRRLTHWVTSAPFGEGNGEWSYRKEV